ncbi:MAG: phosphoadenosine phosphosulfate reductase family protein [Elusimicrobiota bacterium]
MKKNKDWAFSYDEFKEMVEWPLKDKISRAEQLILSELKDADNPMVACSWGKDSMALLHLVRKFCKNVAVCFHNTKVQYPETYKFRDKMLKKWDLYNQYYETEPVMDFWECAKRYGHPEFRSRDNKVKCCWKMKERPAIKFIKRNNIDVEFVGLQATESNMRRLSFLQYGETLNSKKYNTRVIRPLMIWTDEDIWEYHKINDIPYNPLYDEMERTGCMPCSGFKGWEKVMKNYNPGLYKVIKKQRKENNQEVNENFDKECFDGN